MREVGGGAMGKTRNVLGGLGTNEGRCTTE